MFRNYGRRHDYELINDFLSRSSQLEPLAKSYLIISVIFWGEAFENFVHLSKIFIILKGNKAIELENEINPHTLRSTYIRSTSTKKKNFIIVKHSKLYKN